MEFEIESPESQLAFGVRLAAGLVPPCVIYLEGDLGTGKTTLTRGILKGLGHRGSVRSPTYTLLEPYDMGGLRLYHLDLYRLSDPEEIEYLGLRDLLAEPALWVIEWPGKGQGMLPAPDLLIEIDYRPPGRSLTLTASTSIGRLILEGLAAGAA